MSSINTSALARSSPNLENQLISLWAAVEVLLSDPSVGVARIVHYSDLLAPCVCAKYVRRYIIAIYDELLVSYRRKLTKIIGNLPTELGIDVYTKFTHIIFDDKYIDSKRELFAMCEGNPLALHHLWKLNKDFETPVALIESLASHEKRVYWQIHRIYRARNQLVHAGQAPAYLESLVLNLFEYYRSAIGSILNRASKEEAPSEIDQIVSEVAIEFKIYKRMINAMGSAPFDPSSFSRVFR